jgi:putative transposase
MVLLFQPQKSLLKRISNGLHQAFKTWTKPARPSQILGTLADLNRSKAELMAENALLRQQLIVLNRQSKVKRPQFKSLDRFLIMLLASRVSAWKQALLILKPDTLLQLHSQGFRLFWKLKSKRKSTEPKISPEIVTMIKQMAAENQIWGAERIRGELLKLGIKVSKRTIQKFMEMPRPSQRPNQNWSIFLKNHSQEIWACDYFGVTDIFFRQLYAFVIVELSSRRIVHMGVTRHPTDEWTAQQLKEATPFEQRPKYLIRDNDRKFGPQFQVVADSTGIEILKTPIKAPNANAVCERLVGSFRRECLDSFLILSERHPSKVLKEYREFYNNSRPHQGIGQDIPIRTQTLPAQKGEIVVLPVLGGLHHTYQRAA